MTRVREKGSVAGFVIIAIVLTALLVGGIYLVKNYFGKAQEGANGVVSDIKEVADDTTDKAKELANNDKSTQKESEQQAAKDKKDASQSEEKKDKQPTMQKDEQSNNTEESHVTTSDGDSEKSQSTEQSESMEQARQQSETQQASSDTTTQQSTNTTEQQTHTELPKTGPADTFMALLSTSLLAGVGVAYYRSLRAK